MSGFFKEMESKEELLRWGKSLPNPFLDAPSAFSLSQNKMINVPDGTYLITNTESQRSLVSTYGMGPCIAVGLFCPDNKSAAVAHFTVSTDPYSLLTVLQNMYPESISNVRAVIRGGREDNIFSVNLAVRLLNFMRQYGLDLYGAELFRKYFSNNGFAIDPADGSIFSEALAQTSAHPLGSWPTESGMRPILRVFSKDRK